MTRTPFQRKRELERRRKVATALAGMDAMYGKTSQERARGLRGLAILGRQRKRAR